MSKKRNRPSDTVRNLVLPSSRFIKSATSDLVDFGFIIDVLRREKWLLAGLVFGALVLTYLHLQRVPPVYTTSAQVLLDTRQERALNGEQVVSNLTANNSVIAGEVELIRSNLLLGKVVDDLGLVDHPAYDPRANDEPGMIASLQTALFGAEADPLPRSAEELRSQVISRLQRDVTVSQVGISYAIRVSAKAGSPEMAATLANRIAEQYIEDQVAAKRAATVRATSWLQERLTDLSSDLEAADNAVMNFRTNMTEELGGDEAATEQLLADLNARYIAIKVDRLDAEFRYRMVRDQFEAGGYAALADIVTSPLLETLDRERAELERSRAEMSRTLGNRHPQMIGISAQIEDINRSIQSELNRRIEATRSEMEMAINREKAILDAKNDILAQRTQIAAATITLNQLERSASAIRETYENSLTRFMETTAQTELQRSDAQVISTARPPSSPSEPRKVLLLAMAAFFSLSAGTAIVFMREAMNKSVYSSEALREVSNLPVLSLVPHVPHKRRDPQWLQKEITSNGQSPFMEGIRTIRAKLFDVQSIGRPKVLMVTSSVAGEGKSVTSLALAHSLTRASLSVVVVDADLRRSVNQRDLKLDAQDACLVDYLEGSAGMADVIQHVPGLGIDIVMPHRVAQNSSDLISSKAFGAMIQYLSSRYDVVIIDTAPVLAVSDALVISGKSDAAIMVVQTNRAAATMVRAAIQRLDEAGAVLLGTVLSQVRRRSTAAREVYDYAGY